MFGIYSPVSLATLVKFFFFPKTKTVGYMGGEGPHHRNFVEIIRLVGYHRDPPRQMVELAVLCDALDGDNNGKVSLDEMLDGF